MVERLAAAFGVGPGTVVPVTFLTPEEHTQWDRLRRADGPSMDSRWSESCGPLC